MDELIHYYSVDVAVTFDIDLDSDQIDTELTSDIHDTFVEELQEAFKNNPDVDLDDYGWDWNKEYDYIQYLYISSKLDKTAVTPIVENILDSIVSFERTDELWDGTCYVETHGLDTPPYEHIPNTRDYTYNVEVECEVIRFFETNEDGEILVEKVTKNELKDRATKHAKKQNGLSPFCSLSERLLDGEKNFVIEYDFYNVNGCKITDHDKGVIYASTTNEAVEKFNGLVERAREYDQSFVCIGKPIFLNDSLIDIGDKYKVYRDGKMIKDNSLVEAKKKKLDGTLRGSLTEEVPNDMKEFPYMFFYSATNPTFGYDFQEFAQSIGARRAYGRYRGTGAGSYFYVVPSEDVYDKIKKVAKNRFVVDVQKLLPFNPDEFPNAQFTDTLTEANEKRKKRLGGTLNTNAGNVEHNINMFNHVNSPIDGPNNNPVSGPFGGDINTDVAGGSAMGESLKTELWDSSRVVDLVRYYLDRNNYEEDTLRKLIISQMKKEGSSLPSDMTRFDTVLFRAIDDYNSAYTNDFYDDLEINENVFMEEYDFTNIDTTYTKEVGMNDYFESMDKEDNE